MTPCVFYSTFTLDPAFIFAVPSLMFSALMLFLPANFTGKKSMSVEMGFKPIMYNLCFKDGKEII